ncbi:DoxX family membrane protein [Patescibacteria group bacterium]|nr:DoxX family membrane protein [Patescibacteria group bacterium]
MTTYTLEQSRFAHFFTANKASAPLWFVIRLYLGYEFLMAGWEKLGSAAWFGSGAGAALTGFIHGAVAKTVCAPNIAAAACHPDVQMWYASFLQNAVLPNVTVWSNAVVIGELAIGLGLIVGLFTGVAAFFAFFMSLNFLFSGAVSVNPIIIILALPLIASRRVAGYWGLDRFARPCLRRKFHRFIS